MKFMNELYVKATNKIAMIKNDERGSQTLEWIGIAAVIIIVVGLISTSFETDGEFGNKIRQQFEEWLGKIGGKEGSGT